ncbi:MAG TPA: ATP-binding protein [Candidatus Limnocylindria bacterium]|jgi:PAS domain S-box-containing protein|nr:ATP-binding protein [Candidatus Limnocylindria bacterium]
MPAADTTHQPRFLQAAPTLLRACLEHFADGIALVDATDPELAIVYVNQGFARLTGYSLPEVLGKNCRFLQAGDSDQPELALMRRAIAKREPITVTLRNYRKNGSLFWNRIAIQPIRVPTGEVAFFMGTLRDVSHERGLEENVQQAQKLEAIGMVAGGVAHDFNNVLGVILGTASLLQAENSVSPEVASQIEVIADAASRGAALARQLLAFGKRSPREPKVFSPIDCIQGMEKMLSRLLPENIAVHTEVLGTVPDVFMDPGEFEQILFNMVINARDAMAHGGRIHVALQPGRQPVAPITDDSPRETLPLPPCGVDLRISDTGTGIDPDFLARIFEPFVTTKPAGKGTGLGLSVCQMIVRRYGGTITVHSQVDVGTTFSVWLPGCTGAEPSLVTAPIAENRGNLLGKHVLVVEDDVPLRSVFLRVLKRLGATSTILGRAEEAVEWLKNPKSPRPDLLLTDQILPQMPGSDLIKLVRHASPKTRALLVSGHVTDAETETKIASGEIAFLAKPFTVSELQARLCGMLAEG